MKKALLVIDMLNDFVLEGAPLEVPQNRDILPALSRRIRSSRAAGISVIFVCDEHLPDDPEFSRMGWPPHAVRGTDGARVVAELAPQDSDYVVLKKTYSSFFETELDPLLTSLGVEELEVTGCVSNICVMSAVADAALRGYRVLVPVDSVASIDESDGAFAFRQMEDVYGATVVR